MPERDINWLIENIGKLNIAEDLDDDELANLGSYVKTGYDEDKESRADWEKANEAGMELAKQLSKGRQYAGESVADVMYPAIGTAAIQYSARAFPAIIKSNEVVKARIIGYDQGGIKASRGERVSYHMNYQILEQMKGWIDGMDRLLISHCILGDYFKKIYYDQNEGVNVSEPVSPEDLVVHYWAKSLEKAPRKTHVLQYTHNEYLEKVYSGEFLDIKLEKPESGQDKIHTFYEQHNYYDLDGDEYEEPYVVTIHEEGKVVKVSARYKEDGIKLNDDGQITKIKADEYFVQYPFLPSFDGSFYNIGFGILLSPINKSINTIINQLLDAGKRSIRQSGFLGRGVRLLKGGESGVVRLKAGEWKQVQALGQDLKKAIVPIPSGEPSAVLFNLLGLLLEALKILSSQSELLAGQQQQHNVPATTTLALIEQGLQVFSGIYKRVFGGLKKELQMIYNLNRDFLSEEDYQEIVDSQDAKISDYAAKGYDIVPVSTSATITDTQKYVKAQGVREWYGTPDVNGQAVAKHYFEAIELPEEKIKELLTLPQPQPSFEQQIEFEKLRLKDMELRLKAEEIDSKTKLEFHKQAEIQSKVIKNLADAEAAEIGQQMNIYQMEADGLMKQVEMKNKQLEMLQKLKQEAEAKEAAQKQGA